MASTAPPLTGIFLADDLSTGLFVVNAVVAAFVVKAVLGKAIKANAIQFPLAP